MISRNFSWILRACLIAMGVGAHIRICLNIKKRPAVEKMIFTVLAVYSALAVIPGHEITSLPGWEGDLPTKMYSGYIPVGNTSGTKGMIHYW